MVNTLHKIKAKANRVIKFSAVIPDSDLDKDREVHINGLPLIEAPVTGGILTDVFQVKGNDLFIKLSYELDETDIVQLHLK